MGMKKRHTHAFSLTELAIVITVMGLVVGGVLSARSMIRSGELSAVLRDASNYIVAVNTFHQQYRYLPGDFSTASSYWSAASNGNGDGQITGLERFYVWQHLYLAGLVQKSMTGAQGAGGVIDFVIGSNVPDTSLKGAAFALYYTGSATAPVAATSSTYALSTGNTLTFGASAGTNAGPPINAILTPIDASGLDVKADDGIPGTGKWVANLTGPGGAAADYNFSGTNACATGTNAGPGAYNLTKDTISCGFFIKTGL